MIYFYFYLNLGSSSSYCLRVEWAGRWTLNFSEMLPFHTPTEVVGLGGCLSHQLFKHSILPSMDFMLKILSLVCFLSLCWASGDVLAVWPRAPAQWGTWWKGIQHTSSALCNLNREKAEARAFFQEAPLVSGCYLLCSLCRLAHLSPSPGRFWNLS